MRQRKGYSLIEMMVAIFLMGMIGSLLVALFRMTYRTYKYETNRGSLQIIDRNTLERINREIRQSLGIVASNGAYTTGANTIVIQLASVDGTQTIIPATYDYVVYRRNPAKTSDLQEIMVAAAGSNRKNHTQTLANSLTGLTFTYYDKSGATLNASYTTTKRVQAQLNTSRTNYGKAIPINYTTQATIRNQ